MFFSIWSRHASIVIAMPCNQQRDQAKHTHDMQSSTSRAEAKARNSAERQETQQPGQGFIRQQHNQAEEKAAHEHNKRTNLASELARHASHPHHKVLEAQPLLLCIRHTPRHTMQHEQFARHETTKHGYRCSNQQVRVAPHDQPTTNGRVPRWGCINRNDTVHEIGAVPAMGNHSFGRCDSPRTSTSRNSFL